MIIKKKVSKKQNTEFGVVASLAMLIVSVWHKIDLNVYIIILLLASLLFPVIYTPFAWLWFGLAKVLERIMSKVALLLIFVLVITPVGLIRRVFGKDNLHKSRSQMHKNIFENQIHTYKPCDFENQF